MQEQLENYMQNQDKIKFELLSKLKTYFGAQYLSQEQAEEYSNLYSKFNPEINEDK